MSSDELKVGIVGCGGISRAHVRGYQHASGVRIVSVFDTFTASAQALASETGADVSESLEAMANGGEIDAVSICTPPGVHLENCLPFLRAGIPILCEKPLEIDIGNAIRLKEAGLRSESLFMIAFCHRFHPYIVEARRILTEETDLIGEPLFFRNFFGGRVDIGQGFRSQPKASGGGVLIDNCSHSLDLFRFLIGEVESIQARVGNIAQQAQVEDFADIMLSGQGGAQGQITSSYSIPVVYNAVEIFCSRGTISVNYGIPNRPVMTVHIEGESPIREVTLKDAPSHFVAEIAAFVDYVRTGRAPSPGIEDAIRNSVLVDAAYRSAREGHVVGIQTP